MLTSACLTVWPYIADLLMLMLHVVTLYILPYNSFKQCGTQSVVTFASAGAAQIHRIDGGDVMTSIQSLCAFHPALPVLAGINSSGRCHVFR
eukprot:12261-Heterococcus_DN1.PRE.1